MTEKRQWHEALRNQSGWYFAVNNVLCRGKTNHQNLIILENVAFGRVAALDGVVQIAERDEFVYHEMVTHIPLLAHGRVEHVLIIDGGDGAILHEAARHKNVELVTMAEIDAGVVSFCRQYLPNHNAGGYDGLHSKLVIDDDINFVDRTSQTFDVIISGRIDPISPGESLLTSASYEGCRRCLSPDGIFVAQSGVCFLQQGKAIDSHRKLSHYFSDVDFYQTAISTYYGSIMTFTWTTDNDALRHLSAEVAQARFLASSLKCRYCNPAIHMAASASPQYL